MYRDIIAGAKSRYRQSMVEPGYRLNFVLGRLSGQLTKLVFESMGYNNPEFYVRMDNDFTFSVSSYGPCRLPLTWTRVVEELTSGLCVTRISLLVLLTCAELS